jgi:ATP-dependent Clp protease ATP-binding subunit ClpA
LKLQENWNDNREKTNTILEFEEYILNLYANVDKIPESVLTFVDLIESLLVDGETSKSEKEIALTALKNLTPLNISCTGSTLSELNTLL